MRNKTHLWKRSLAALLCFIMVLGMIPALDFVPAALAVEETESTGVQAQDEGQQSKITGKYITLPITIRDFAADGMLFEYNETDRTTFTRNDDGSITWGTPNTITITDRLTYNQSTTNIFGEREPWAAAYNPDYWDHASTNGTLTGDTDSDGDLDYNYTGLRVYAADYTVYDTTYDQTETSGKYWYCVIVDAYGNVLKVLDLEAAKEDIDTVVDNTAGAAYSVWAWRDPSNVPCYTLLSQITEENKDQFNFGFAVTTELNSGGYNGAMDLYLGHKYRENVKPSSYSHLGIYTFAGDAVVGWLGGLESYDAWHCLIVNSDNQVVEVIPNGVDKVAESANYLTSGYRFVMAWSDGTNRDAYDALTVVTDENKSEYQIVTPACSAGSALFVERTIQINESNTRGFGLLFTKDTDVVHNLYDDGDDDWTDGDQGTITGSELQSFTPSTTVTSQEIKLWGEGGSKDTAYATQYLYGGLMRTNLVAEELDKYGNPRYTEGTVTYLAEYMQVVMATPEKTDGVYNGHHVMGTKMYGINANDEIVYWGPSDPNATLDLAAVIRLMVGDDFNSTADDAAKLGSYDASIAKFEAGELDTPMQIATWYDAAYYLLHSTWRDSNFEEGYGRATEGYGLKIDNYNRIHLIETVNADGQTCYVFNAAYDGTTYDMQLGEIFNSPFKEGEYAGNRDYSGAVLKGDTDPYTTMGNKLPVNRFDPLGPSGAGVNAGFKMTGNTYGEFNGAEVTQDWSEYYYETNYNQSLEGHAQFVFHEDADQYFTFTGDDDVYLYINGHRVLDIGGAHGITKVRVNINDVAAHCELKDGGTYSFDFFYLERHGTAANFGIETNIQIADPSMNTTKTGYQNGVNTGYGGPVNADNHVGYSFEIQNDGTAEIYNLTFDDPTIGVYIGWDKIELNIKKQYKADGTTPLYNLEEDIYLIYWDADDKMHYFEPGSFDEDQLKARLKQGLKPGERLGVYGFKYRIQPNEWVDTDNDNEGDTFINTVYTTATDNIKTLQGVADWKVVKMQHPYEAFHVYDWVHKIVSNDPADAENLVWKSPTVNGIPVANGVTVTKDELITEYLLNGKSPQSLANVDQSKIQITLCTAAGNEDTYFINDNVKNSADGGITYISDTVGKDTVFFKFKNVPGNAVYDSLVFSYEVYTYGAVDNVYVLDYGLSVELAGETFGFQNNDHLKLNDNNRTMVATVTGIVDDKGGEIELKDGTYGNFVWTAKDEDGNEINSLKYTPDAIIDNTDEVYGKFRIMEEDAIKADEEPSIYNSVEMVQKITTAPANVVYYEENFPGITYVNTVLKDENGEVVTDEDGNPVYNNQWVHYETVDEEGNSLAGTEQSADQDMSYGYDDNYEFDVSGDNFGDTEDFWTEGEITGVLDFQLDTSNLSALQSYVGNSLNDYFGYENDLGYSGTDSNGTVNVLQVKEKADVMFFDFVGTGFEILSRTTDEQYAIINVVVYELDENGNIVQIPKTNSKGETVYKDGQVVMTDKIVAAKPVITESKGGDLYQVPIISIKGLDRDNYRVAVKAATTGKVERVLYIDGIRIYGPLSDGEALEYYNPEEYQADTFEVKQMIQDGKVVYLSAGENLDGNIVFNPVLEEGVEGTGYTVIENITEDAESVLIQAANPNEYLTMGPNNELYLDEYAVAGGETLTVCNLIMCILTPMENDANGHPYPETARTVQIGAHRKVNDSAVSDGTVYMVYGKNAEEMLDPENPNTIEIKTGTEMYYPINVSKLEKVKLVKDGVVSEEYSYLLFIGIRESEYYDTTLALTNMKIAGYTVELANTQFQKAIEEDNLEENVMYRSAARYFVARKALVEANNKTPEVEVNENLTITSASLKATKVYSGKAAIVTVKAGAEAQKIVVYDAQGNEVTATRCTSKTSKGIITFTFQWDVYGTKGEAQKYTVRVFDTDGLASVNTEEVTVTIR